MCGKSGGELRWRAGLASHAMQSAMERERERGESGTERSSGMFGTYRQARNECIRNSREKLHFERDVIDKCRDRPKLFYRFINGEITTA